jgi:hypothetical protein
VALAGRTACHEVGTRPESQEDATDHVDVLIPVMVEGRTVWGATVDALR